MGVILFDINNPDHQEALEKACTNAFDKFKGNNLITYQEVKEEDERWNTDHVCKYFGTEGHPVKRATIYKYIREWGLPYTPGRPNTFWKHEVMKWDKEVLSRKRKRD
jgi:transposase